MKVILVNGSPHEHGCTDRALQEIVRTLEAEGVAGEMFWLGTAPVAGCLDCGWCRSHKGCVRNDIVNRFAEKAASCDGFVFGSPVYYGGASGQLTCFLDRLFFSNGGQDNPFSYKPAAVVASARRAGTIFTMDQMAKYCGLMQMPLIQSTYWNEVHGFTPEDVEQDAEGLQTMRNLARNLSWFLKLKQAGAEAGIPLPQAEHESFTPFIH